MDRQSGTLFKGPGDRGGQEGKAAAAGADVQVGPPREGAAEGRAEGRGAQTRLSASTLVSRV